MPNGIEIKHYQGYYGLSVDHPELGKITLVMPKSLFAKFLDASADVLLGYADEAFLRFPMIAHKCVDPNIPDPNLN